MLNIILILIINLLSTNINFDFDQKCLIYTGIYLVEESKEKWNLILIKRGAEHVFYFSCLDHKEDYFFSSLDCDDSDEVKLCDYDRTGNLLLEFSECENDVCDRRNRYSSISLINNGNKLLIGKFICD